MADNVKSMMFAGEIPWHKKGVKLEKEVNSADAIIKAGLDWTVSKKEMFYDGTFKVPDKFAVVRNDDNKCLGVLGNVYRPLQNKEAFNFFDSVIGEASAFYHTAGQLGQGEKIWLLAKLPSYIKVAGDDIVEKYLLLSNSHDGSSPVRMMFTPIRVVCQNTLNIALKGETGSGMANIRHSGLMMDKVQYARKTLKIINENFAYFEEKAKQMANAQLTKAEIEVLIKTSLNIKDVEGEEKIKTRAENIMQEVWGLFEHGKGNDAKEVKGSLWAGLNGIIEYVDYKRNSKGDNRDESILFGSGADIKQRAWDKSLELVLAKR